MRRLLTILALATVAAGCGKSDAEKEREKAAGSGRGTVTCAGSAMTGPTGLPADFPAIDGVTFVKATKSGPTRVVDGYVGRGLDDLYDDLHSKVEDAGYTILFDEKEEDDAEISYKAKDESSEGQIALRSCDEDKTSVHITNRPS